MKYKYTITVGIPVFNESPNIEKLILSILKQRIKGAKLAEVIIVSDGSTDDTSRKIKSFKDKRIKFLINNKRLGLNKTQNKIIKHSSSEILILLDGDILPFNNNSIQNLIDPFFKKGSIGIVAGNNISIPQNTFFGKLIKLSHELKTEIYRNFNKGCNVYLCYGRARAFSKNFYSNLNWPEDVPEDAYSYFECINKNFTFHFAINAKVYFSVPQNLNDHIKQSTRFFDGRKKLEKFFSKHLIKKEYSIPFLMMLKTVSKYFAKQPFKILIYILLSLYIKVFSLKINVNHSKYDPSYSTKFLYE